MTTREQRKGARKSQTTTVMAMLLPLLLSLLAPVSLITPVAAQDAETGLAPQDIWSDEYTFQIFPWGGDSRVQFREYHDYFTMKQRMQNLADQNSEIMTFHDGMNGGMNARGEETNRGTYQGWHYNHDSPWIKITADVHGGECNAFVGDCGNYEDLSLIHI